MMAKFNAYINELDFSELRNFFLENGVLTEYKNREFFCHQNNLSVYAGYIVSGIFRYVCTDDKGTDHIVGYSFAEDFVCDYPSLIKRTNSLTSAQAVIDSKVYLLSRKELENYWETDMHTQRFGRLVAEEIFVEMYQRLLGSYCYTPEQRYVILLKHCPDLLKHISLKEIASLIGVTPETISHIRKKLTFDNKS